MAKIVYAGSTATSYANAAQALTRLAELPVSAQQTRRVCQAVGAERVAERDTAVARYRGLPLTQRKAVPAGVTAPAVAVVGVDGGRLQIFERPAAGTAATEPAEPEVIDDDVVVPEVEDSAAKRSHWREDKIGLLLAMTSDVSPSDPCPEVPASFVNPRWIPELVTELHRRGAVPRDAATTTAPEPATAAPESPKWQPPEVQTKHLVATRRPWEQFGPLVAEQAWSLGFYGASRRAFVGDGAETNWTLWRQSFSSFVPILDFIHALTYVFHAALAGRPFAAGWSIYERWIGWVWRGEVDRVIAELAQRQVALAPPPADAKPTHPAAVVSRALGYLQRHKERMRYATYRQQGLPIVSSYVESAVKQFNYRVKGTEKFWRESGAEEMLQLRADVLSDGDPMAAFWQRRQAGATGQARYRVAA